MIDAVNPVAEDGLQFKAGVVSPWKRQSFDVHDLAADINAPVADEDTRASH
jgi:hypothetical protein